MLLSVLLACAPSEVPTVSIAATIRAPDCDTGARDTGDTAEPEGCATLTAPEPHAECNPIRHDDDWIEVPDFTAQSAADVQSALFVTYTLAPPIAAAAALTAVVVDEPVTIRAVLLGEVELYGVDGDGELTAIAPVTAESFDSLSFAYEVDGVTVEETHTVTDRSRATVRLYRPLFRCCGVATGTASWPMMGFVLALLTRRRRRSAAHMRTQGCAPPGA